MVVENSRSLFSQGRQKTVELWQRYGWQLVRFGFVGIAATLTYVFVGLCWERLFNAYILLGNAVAYFIAFFVSYFGHYLFTFGSAKAHKSVLSKFVVSNVIGFVLNTLIISVGMGYSLSYATSMMIAIVLVPGITFIILRFWVF